MMALFQKATPATQMASRLEAKTAERDKLRNRLTEAVNAVAERRRTAQRLALDGANDSALDQAEASSRTAQDRVSTLTSALAESDDHVTALEHDLADLRDKAQRAATAAEIEEKATKLEELMPQFASLFEQMIAITKDDAATLENWDATCLNKYAADSNLQIPAAIELVARSYRDRRDRVLDGRAAATLTKPPTPIPVIAVKTSPTTKLFATKKVCWTTAEGELVSAGKYNVVDLPSVTAVRALASGACQELGSELWKSWGNTVPISTPPVSECTNLDLDGPAAVTAIIPSDPQFTRIDCGPVVELRIPREVQS